MPEKDNGGIKIYNNIYIYVCIYISIYKYSNYFIAHDSFSKIKLYQNDSKENIKIA